MSKEDVGHDCEPYSTMSVEKLAATFLVASEPKPTSTGDLYHGPRAYFKCGSELRTPNHFQIVFHSTRRRQSRSSIFVSQNKTTLLLAAATMTSRRSPRKRQSINTDMAFMDSSDDEEGLLFSGKSPFTPASQEGSIKSNTTLESNISVSPTSAAAAWATQPNPSEPTMDVLARMSTTPMAATAPLRASPPTTNPLVVVNLPTEPATTTATTARKRTRNSSPSDGDSHNTATESLTHASAQSASSANNKRTKRSSSEVDTTATTSTAPVGKEKKPASKSKKGDGKVLSLSPEADPVNDKSNNVTMVDTTSVEFTNDSVQPVATITPHKKDAASNGAANKSDSGMNAHSNPVVSPPPSSTATKDTTASSHSPDAPSDASAATQKKRKLNFQESVLHRMLVAFKPFNLKSLAAEMQTTETSLQYVMLSLTDKNLVMTKEFTSSKGKGKTLYWANHDHQCKDVQLAWASPQDMDAAKQQVQELQRKHHALTQALSEVTKDMSNEALDKMLPEEEASLKDLQETIHAVHTRIQEAQHAKKSSASRKKSSLRDAQDLHASIDHMRSEWKQRREKCMDFVEHLADGMEKKPKDILRLLDIETDEMAGAVVPVKRTQ
jgi:predicted transcriptional regulator